MFNYVLNMKNIVEDSGDVVLNEKHKALPLFYLSSFMLC